MAEIHKHIFEIHIRATPEKLWQAITDGEFTRHYHFGSAVEGDWKAGGSYRFPNPAGGLYLAGEIIEIEPPLRLVTTFRSLCVPGHEDTLSRVAWEIEPLGDVCKLTLTHSDLPEDEKYRDDLFTGWAKILSGLKTLLETGKPLEIGTAV